MSVTPVNPLPPTIPTQTPSPQTQAKGDNDHDADDAGAARSSPAPHVGGIIDKDA